MGSKIKWVNTYSMRTSQKNYKIPKPVNHVSCTCFPFAELDPNFGLRHLRHNLIMPKRIRSVCVRGKHEKHFEASDHGGNKNIKMDV